MTFQNIRWANISSKYSHEILLVWRYYYVGIINTAFGYGTYSLLIFLGLNLFFAQVISYVAGVSFNYFTFTRHVFRDRQRSVVSFGGAYVFNYFVNVGLLALFHRFMGPYAAGLAAALGASIVNFFVLRYVTFRKTRERA